MDSSQPTRQLCSQGIKKLKKKESGIEVVPKPPTETHFFLTLVMKRTRSTVTFFYTDLSLPDSISCRTFAAVLLCPKCLSRVPCLEAAARTQYKWPSLR